MFSLIIPGFVFTNMAGDSPPDVSLKISALIAPNTDGKSPELSFKMSQFVGSSGFECKITNALKRTVTHS